MSTSSLKVGTNNIKKLIQYNPNDFPWNNECWKAYNSTNIVWSKDKTLNNVWLEYGIAQKGDYTTILEFTESPNGHTIRVNNIKGYTDIVLPDSSVKSFTVPSVTDLLDNISSSGSCINWNCPNISNSMWVEIKNWYENNTISYIGDSFNSGLTRLFKGANLPDGTYKFKVTGNLLFGYDTFGYVNTGHGSQGHNVDIEFHAADSSNYSFSSMNNFLRSVGYASDHTSDLAMWDYTLRSCKFYNYNNEEFACIQARDLSGLLSLRPNFSSFGKSIIFNIRNSVTEEGTERIPMYHYRSTNGATSVQFMVDNCSRFDWGYEGFKTFENTISVGSSPTDIQRDVDINTLVLRRYCPQFLNGLTRFSYFGPIIDMRYIIPNTSDTASMFLNLGSNLSGNTLDMRIKNLNHGNWNLTANPYYLVKLNQASVEYLINNLTDLTVAIPNWEDPVTGISHPQWDNPQVQSATITCPANWSSWITATMISNAGAKGWTIIFQS